MALPGRGRHELARCTWEREERGDSRRIWKGQVLEGFKGLGSEKAVP